MFCPKCGNKIENGELFCGNCGCKIEPEQEIFVQPNNYPGVKPNAYPNSRAGYNYIPKKGKSKKPLIITFIVIAALVIIGVLAAIIIPKLKARNSYSSGYSDSVFDDFQIEGKWKNVGETTCAQMQRGSIITFDGSKCNVYSPSDTYAFYKENGEYHLDCTSFFAGDSMHFIVTIINNDNIELKYSTDTIVSLCRVGGTPVTNEYNNATTAYNYNYNTYTSTTTERYEPQHTYRVIPACVSWFDAKAECERSGGHLATITSQEEYDEICRLADQSGLKYIWLGARIYSSSDSFDEWITGESMNFTKWYPGEPSKTDVDGTEEFYLCLWNVKYKGNDMGWTFNDQRNDLPSESSIKSESIGYVIEYDS